MRLNDLLEFKKELYFDGAVQVDWFYSSEKSKKVSENFVFHGSKYHGVESLSSNRRIDTISFVKTIGEKLKDESSNYLSLAIADYGTGKSHLAVTLAQLLSGPDYMNDTFNKIISNISKIEKKDSEIIKDLYNNRNLVLVINGMRDFNLHSEILKTAQKALNLHGISDQHLKKINKSIEIAEVFFERNNVMFITHFNEAAKNHGWNERGNLLINKIRNNLLVDDVAFEIINDVYEMTTGHKIRWDEGLSASNILEELLNDYCGADGAFDSIVILFDEFGRYLEYASSVGTGKSGDSALQQIFECTQNFEGKLHVINFIQSDIKTYLQRVDNTKNISRYIGRYDVSDKYYISSNLETVFANLIYRKDKQIFTDIIVKSQKQKETLWNDIFNSLNNWCSTHGVWNDYYLFRNVIVEGIYPMHPVSTFMLSQLSDYLQNRSSLTLISQYIQNFSNIDISDSYFTILPEKLMTGDLFTEMLTAEQEGKQTSQHCIRYYNVIRKYEDKLNDTHLKVLRSNLVLRVLKCRTTSLDDVIKGLMFCSGLPLEDIRESLDFLENEYGILGYDERAFCFDFMEESNGAHDYKIVKKRLLASASYNPFLLRNNQEILGLTGNEECISSNFGVVRRISSNEWVFKQSLYPAEDINEKLINKYLVDWRNSIKPEEPKGHIIWVYINKYTNLDVLDNLKKLSSALENTPILLMVLNDTENRLYNDLIEYSVINSMDESIKNKYDKHYIDDLNQNLDRLKTEFSILKKEKLYITSSGIKSFLNRLPKELTNIFEGIYPKTPSFHFDGLLSKVGNISPKQNNNFLTILKLLMGNVLDENVIHNYQIEVRNRITGLLYVKSNTSWKCLNEQYRIIPPLDSAVRNIYNEIVDKFDDTEYIDCGELFDTLVKPPYGLNTYSCLLMIAIFIANLDFCTRISYLDKIYSPKAWRDLLFVKEGKFDFDIVKKSKLIKVDAGVTEEKFIKLFKAIENNKDIDCVQSLSMKLDDLVKENDLPERLEDAYKLAKKNLGDGENAKKEWLKKLSEIEKLNNEMTPNDLYKGFEAIEIIKTTNFEILFSKYNYEYLQYYQIKIDDLKEDIENYIDEHFVNYVSNMRCNEVERLIQFRNHGAKTVKFIKTLGYIEYAEMMKNRVDTEIRNVELIRDKQNLKQDCEKFIKDCKINKYTSFVQLKEYKAECQRLILLFNQYNKILGKDAVKLKTGLAKVRDLIKQEYEHIFAEIGNIFDDVYNIKYLSDIVQLLSRVDEALKRGLPDSDKESLNDLKGDLVLLQISINELITYLDDREIFASKSNDLINKYKNSETDINSDIINAIVLELNKCIDDKELNWINKYLTYSGEAPEIIYAWKEKTRNLPKYLSSSTIEKYKINLLKAEAIISKDKINTAKHYFDLLSDEEKEKFLILIKN